MKQRQRRFTLAKRDDAYDAICDALNDAALTMSEWERGDLRRARDVLISLTSRLPRP